ARTSLAPPGSQRSRSRPYGAAADIGSFASSPPYVIAGRSFGLSPSDSILITLDGGSNTNVQSGGSFRFDSLAVGSHSLVASNPRFVVAPGPLNVSLGPDVFDAHFPAYP